MVRAQRFFFTCVRLTTTTTPMVTCGVFYILAGRCILFDFVAKLQQYTRCALNYILNDNCTLKLQLLFSLLAAVCFTMFISPMYISSRAMVIYRVHYVYKQSYNKNKLHTLVKILTNFGWMHLQCGATECTIRLESLSATCARLTKYARAAG